MAEQQPLTANWGFDYRERIGRVAEGVAVLDYLARRYAHSTRQDWQDRIEEGRVIVDGVPAAPETVLRPGQTLVWRRPPWREAEVPLSFAVLYEDDHLLAVAKPSGLPTVPGGGFLENTLLSLVRRRFPAASPLHRLDRGTSGLVLFARSAVGRTRLSEAWRRGEVRKTYRALVQGSPERAEFSVDIPIGPVPRPHLGFGPGKGPETLHAASPRGRRAHSEIRVLERRGGESVVEVDLLTGRPHQIRIHLAAAGHPLVGEPLFGRGGLPAQGDQADPRRRPALPGDPGFLLHAERVLFAHPATGTRLEVFCLAPPALRLRGQEALAPCR
jgi:23S rRNA pseudouridine1911/1915/1917 synthase